MSAHEGSDFSREQAGSWMAADEPDRDVLVTSRIRLARNVRDYPFKARLSEDGSEKLEQFLREQLGALAIAPDQVYVNLEAADSLDRELLLERHLISVELARGPGARGVLLSQSQHLSVMVNEEDHLRMQILGPGQRLQPLLERVQEIDRAVGERVEYARHERFGFLTSCPTNVGTGLRMSVMLHLPALVYSKEIEKIFNSAARMKLAVRGFYGEGTSYLGDFFQISNQVTLGCGPAKLLQDLVKILPRIVEHERDVRRLIHKDHKQNLEDRIYRSLGVLSSARKLNSQEALELLSRVRMGVCLGLLDGVELKTLNELLVLSQPAHIQRLEGRELGEEERDAARARYIRSRLAQENGS